MDDTEDQRDIELSSLFAIFPEISTVNDNDPYTIALELPVNPAQPVTVFFPAATEANSPNADAARNGDLDPAAPARNLDSHELSHLPSVALQISLPPNYPSEKPPRVNITSSPFWLPSDTAQKLEEDCARLWEELGRDSVAYTFIDHVQQASENCFGLVSDTGALEIKPEHKIAVLDYDLRAKQAAFEKGTFMCGVCLDPKKGKSCHRMLDCGHVFCIQCLQDFYNNAITEGDLAAVRCLEPNCAKERGAAQPSTGRRRRKAKVFISPSELLQIPLEQDMVKRYVTLKYKTELESDKNTIYCPRTWCQGAARSKKHKKPEGLDLQQVDDDSESESEDEVEQPGDAAGEKVVKPFKAKDLLAVCEDCGFAFCSRCYQGWHGEFFRCTPKRDQEELTAEEQASLEYVKLHTSPCPTCDSPAQKTHGCNHMICYKCQTHFCYLCSAWLDPSNPYQHFNKDPKGHITGCYNRLWELENGDEGEGDLRFAGGGMEGWDEVDEDSDDDAPDAPGAPEAERLELVPEIEEADENGEVNADGANHEDDPDGHEQRVDVAREGPLVLRIAADPPAARGGRAGAHHPPPAAPQPPQAGNQNRDRNNVGLRNPQQGGQRGRGGRGRRAGVVGLRGGGQRQAQNPPRPNHPRNNARPARGVLGFNGRRDRHFDEQLRQDFGPGELDAANQAWVRHFVRLALDDNEDQIEVESDDEEDVVLLQ